MLRFKGMLGLAVFLASSATTAAPRDYQPALSSYWSIGFGGPQWMPNDLRYGFQLNYASLRTDTPALRFMEVNLRGSGFESARLAGVDVLQGFHILNQTDASATPSAEKSVGEQFGSAFKGLGIGLGALAIAGGIAVYAMAEGADEVVQSGFTPNSPENDPVDQCVVPIPPPIGSGCVISTGYAQHETLVGDADKASLLWLDSGNGQMGDLQPH